MLRLVSEIIAGEEIQLKTGPRLKNICIQEMRNYSLGEFSARAYNNNTSKIWQLERSSAIIWKPAVSLCELYQF